MQRILIVDDSSTARSLIKKSLGICGLGNVHFEEADNGKHALEILRSEPVDLVLTDVNMPTMDGLNLLKRIKSSPKLCDIPVVVITSLKNNTSEQLLISEQAVAVLGKPIAIPEMYRLLKEQLHLI
ncbi:response regulator [candidate division KSB1 bacterium]|jgi:two-component system chemotaxis response regulator CheY|nr:MAG: response regulator [candidate division KSB1 bacterium]